MNVNQVSTTYRHGCDDCDWSETGTNGTRPAHKHHTETGHTTTSERTTTYVYGTKKPEESK